MQTTTPTPSSTATNTPAQVAKGALRRLALSKLEPTPENYARAYNEESGQPAPTLPDIRSQGPAWALLIEKLMRGIERGGRQWTPARKKESLQRVLDSSRGDLQRLQQRLQSLVAAWEGDRAAEDAAGGDSEAGATPAEPRPVAAPAAAARASSAASSAVAAIATAGSFAAHWTPYIASLQTALQAALPADESRTGEISDRLAALTDALTVNGPSRERLADLDDVCRLAMRIFSHRHHLVDQLGELCRELSVGLTELAEDDSWARGQCENLQARLADGISSRSVKAAGQVLAETRERQQRVRGERDAARDALKALIQNMLSEVGELGEQTGRFQESVWRHAEEVEHADSLEGLAGVVREMVDESRTARTLVGQAQQRMHDAHDRAGGLEARVRELEGEMRRLSDEVLTDALTQVANRRGLAQAFEVECARAMRAGPDAPPLAIGLIDIDNFKRLNDTLGHAVGDSALKALAAAVRERLRPVDQLARFGGEEFVVLLPATPLADAQKGLTRLQRGLTEALFLHEQQEVFVTFSAGVTAWRPGEDLQTALERADEALYEAKRNGKNRTCSA